MTVDHNILCSGVLPQGMTVGRDDVELNLWDRSLNWNLVLNLEQIHGRFYQNTNPRFIDFLEIATYVYCADQIFKRGGLKDVDSFGANWRRHLKFHIPVRDIDFWLEEEVQDALRDTLHFLSDDHFYFSFLPAVGAPQLQEYLQLGDETTGAAPEQVMMFSGGLDSLGGAIQEAIVEKRRIMLVNHRSTKKLNTVHRSLMSALAQKAGPYAPDHMHVDINKKIKNHNKEYTQRTRSFLFLALGSSIANMLGLDSLRFYENGVISLNLPISAQTVGSRSTRTTHPRILHQYSTLVSLIAGKPFKVENPFIWKTRGEIIKLIVDAGCSDLIASSMSCAHVWHSTKEKTHCGKCSQCIDRRIGMFAVGADQYDPDEIYRTNVFTDAADHEEDQLLNAAFLERANHIEAIKDEMDFFRDYSGLGRALPYLGGPSGSALSRCLDLYRRHAAEVNTAMDVLLAHNASAIRRRTLAADCMIRMFHESNAPMSAPTVSVVEKVKIIEAEDPALKNIETKLDTVIGKGFDLEKQIDRLQAMYAKGLFDFLQKCDAESLRYFLAILSAGDIAKASRALDMADRTLRDRVNAWQTKEHHYQVMFDLVGWRKKVGGKVQVPFNDALNYESDPASASTILKETLEALRDQDSGNWESVRDELVEILEEEVPQ